jgi:hypothetical protein
MNAQTIKTFANDTYNRASTALVPVIETVKTSKAANAWRDAMPKNSFAQAALVVACPVGVVGYVAGKAGYREIQNRRANSAA